MNQAPGKKWDHLIINTHLATMTGDSGYGTIDNGALAISDERIAWIGYMKDLPDAPSECAVEVHSAQNRWLTPGLIDCHTHMVFAGNRAGEFEQRLKGASYESIAAAGGGIMSTVRATRSASENALVEAAAGRLRHLSSEGTTTVEAKSGYGLTTEAELRILRAIQRLDERSTTRVVPTFLGAHAVPPEFSGESDRYLDLVIEEMLPQVAELPTAVAVDAYCESIAFSRDQVARLFAAARDAGLQVKLHADQLSDLDGAALAAEFGALSADHLEYASDAGIRAMAKAGTVAVMLPGAFYTLRETQLPPIDLCREAGVRMAVSTDCNPGTSPLSSLITAMNNACILFRMTAEEALRGVTINAAHALGLSESIGSLEVGKLADIAIWDIDAPGDLCYWVGGRRCTRLYKSGQVVF